MNTNIIECKTLVRNWINTGNSLHKCTELIALVEGNHGLELMQVDDPDWRYAPTANLIADVLSKHCLGTTWVGYELTEFYAEDDHSIRRIMVTAVGPHTL